MNIPIERPDYATIYNNIGVTSEIELSFCSDIKRIFKLRIFDKKRAQLEEVRLTDFNVEKNIYNTLIGSKFTDISGIKDVRNTVKIFTDKARTITFNDEYSNYKCDVYYKDIIK